MSNIAISTESFRKFVLDGYIPNEIIEIVNDTLKLNYKGKNEITIIQDNLVCEICRRLEDTMIDIGNGRLEPFNREMIFKRNWLDFEYLYREKGWKVEYDKPAYCETYPAFWKFTIPDK